jgi:hypothetical protein
MTNLSKITSPNKTRLPRSNVFIPIQDEPQKICLLQKKILLLISYTYYHKSCKILSTFTSRCNISIFTVSASIFLTLTPNTPILFTVTPKHTITSLTHCSGYQHFLQPFAITSTEICCHAVMIHTH